MGSFAIQIAKHVLKLRVVATASRPESVEYCKKVGADVVISHKKPLLPQLNMHNIQGIESSVLKYLVGYSNSFGVYTCSCSLCVQHCGYRGVL